MCKEEGAADNLQILPTYCLQMGPAVGISFSVFRVVQQGILHYLSDCTEENCHLAPGNAHRPEYLLLASTTAGSIAGFVSKSMTYPFDLAKRRLQIAVGNLCLFPNRSSLRILQLQDIHTRSIPYIETVF